MYRNGLGWIRERIDYAFATMKWLNMFPSARLHHLASSASDHCCLMLRTNKRFQRRKSKKIFRFESMWLKDGRCGDIVKESWAEGELIGRGNIFSSCMDRCKEALIKWNMQEFGHIGKKLAKAQELLQALEAGSVGCQTPWRCANRGQRSIACWI